MQLNTFTDERMKILYALSFMHGGIVQVWAQNKTNVVLSHTSTFSTLTELLAGIGRTFGDPDQERTALSQLHSLKMTMGMTEDKYMAKFEMLAEGPASMRWLWRMHSSKVSLSRSFSRSTQKCHYHQALTTGRTSYTT